MIPIYRKQANETRWASFENPSGAKGQGGRENQGAKGHAFDSLAPGETKVLLDVAGCGLIHRMWLTLPQRTPDVLRALRLEMFWDGAATPAVAVPLGDFFCTGLGLVPFENELFASPEGRSFVATVPMPFGTAARITLTNESEQPISHLFYDINYTLTDTHDVDVLYFHAHWRRENPTTLGQDFAILLQVTGGGRFLGTFVSVLTNPLYGDTWWGEGEVKVYLDGDDAYPTLVGTGTEDYIGTGWGQGVFSQRYQGSLIARQREGWYAFYRFHVPDPIFFEENCRVTIQQMGGAATSRVMQLLSQGVSLQIVSADGGNLQRFVNVFDEGLDAADPAIAGSGWCNFYRQDDWAAVAYFYLDAPENGLPPLAPVAERVAGLTGEERLQTAVPASLLQAFYVGESLRAKAGGFAFNLHNPTEAETLIAFKDLVVDGANIDPGRITLISMNGEVRTVSAVTAAAPLLFLTGTTLRIQVAGERLEPGRHDLVVRLLLQEIPGLVEIAFTDDLVDTES